MGRVLKNLSFSSDHTDTLSFFPHNPPMNSCPWLPSPSSPPLCSPNPDSSKESEEYLVAYQLRNISIPFLGKVSQKFGGSRVKPTSPSGGKGRGRRSFLSKTQSRVAIDMEARRQLSIVGPLEKHKP
jgi:hypothetical protein